MTDDDVDVESRIIIESVSEILCILNETPGPAASLQILSAVTVFILCNGITSARDADEAYRVFTNVIADAMRKAEASGAAMWTRGTSH